jgi:hypothetical protein
MNVELTGLDMEIPGVIPVYASYYNDNIKVERMQVRINFFSCIYFHSVR